MGVRLKWIADKGKVVSSLFSCRYELTDMELPGVETPGVETPGYKMCTSLRLLVLAE